MDTSLDSTVNGPFRRVLNLFGGFAPMIVSGYASNTSESIANVVVGNRLYGACSALACWSRWLLFIASWYCCAACTISSCALCMFKHHSDISTDVLSSMLGESFDVSMIGCISCLFKSFKEVRL